MRKQYALLAFVAALLWCAPGNKLLAQTIENVQLSVKDNVIKVSYDLNNCPGNRVYDIGVKFKTDDDHKITANSLTGDTKRTTCGTGKSVFWHPLTEGKEIKGNLAAIVQIEHTYYKRKAGAGPAAALCSVVLPGWGDYYVTPRKEGSLRAYWLVSAAYLCCVGGAIGEHANYTNRYNLYHKATTQTDIDNYYDMANRNFQNMGWYITAAASILVIDVIHVIVKGTKNREVQREYAMNSDNSFKFYLTGGPQGLQVGLFKNF